MKRLEDGAGNSPLISIRLPRETKEALDALIERMCSSVGPLGPLPRGMVHRAVIKAGIEALANQAGIKIETTPKPIQPGTSGPRRRFGRATAAEVQNQKELAFEAARKLSPGFRKGDVMTQSGSNVDLGRALGLLVKEGRLLQKGDRRKARYWVKSTSKKKAKRMPIEKTSPETTETTAPAGKTVHRASRARAERRAAARAAAGCTCGRNHVATCKLYPHPRASDQGEST